LIAGDSEGNEEDWDQESGQGEGSREGVSEKHGSIYPIGKMVRYVLLLATVLIVNC